MLITAHLYSFLQHLVAPNSMMNVTLGNDFRIILICNAYSTNQEYFARHMNILLDAMNGNAKTANGTPIPAVTYSVAVLDSLTVHSKMSLIHSFVTQMLKQAQNKTPGPAPALIETYARLLVYTEIESLGIKGFLSELRLLLLYLIFNVLFPAQLLPTVFKNHAWAMLHTLMEMFSYRLHHVPTHYRVQLLSLLYSLSSIPQTNKMQLNLW